MGRRSVHTPEELRELILKAATELIERGGLASLSAREIARAIGYSPGTLYNVFENLDDLVLTIEARMLDQLSARLIESLNGSDPSQRIFKLAHAYLRFTHQNRSCGTCCSSITCRPVETSRPGIRASWKA